MLQPFTATATAPDPRTAHGPRDAHVRLPASAEDRDVLGQDQLRVARHILGSPDRLVAVEGKAAEMAPSRKISAA